MKQGKCDIHGIWLDVLGECHFCRTSDPQNRSGEGVKIVGGGPKSGVKTLSKEQPNVSNGTEQDQRQDATPA